MDLSKGQADPATWKAAVWDSGAGTCATQPGSTGNTTSVCPACFLGVGVDLHQPFLVAWAHPSKALRPQYSLKFPLEAELSGLLFPFLIKAVEQKKAPF